MSLKIADYLGSIIRNLNEIDPYNGETSTVTSASNVSASNKHRPLLESIRSDLYHFDDEKRVRIIFNITNYLDNHPDEESELIPVLHRILQVVEQYKQTGQILRSPSKPDLSSERVSQLSPRGNGAVRALFPFIDPLLEKDK